MKRKIMRATIFAVAAAAILTLSSCGYNRLQALEEQVFRSFGDLEAQLQRRYDLIPNLVETVKGYADREQETLVAVTEARSRVGSIQAGPDIVDDPEKLAQFQEAQGELSSALSRLLVVTENYPELKADQGFLDLQNQLEGTENRIAVARQRYNEAVQSFNTSIRRFPESLTNNLMLNLERKEYFQASSGADEAPSVDF
ncbi:LemA family protein [Salinispira pacifica]|uniref:LemA family protein n=1 Tax=Salinispira pacifica TaxID=1307761 RepID=V5WJ80_9SPIO|nr:LemA family protein [Salinispira pacifica]AHC15690.1 LemA family protein [Salinispira pacifica]